MKKLLNEVLPDPKPDADRGSPRERTSAHWKRIVAAAAALQLGTAAADNSVPGDKGHEGKNPKPPDVQKPPEKPPEVHYMVVDPVPQPYINRNEGEGYLRIESKPPGAEVLVDGESIGKTPIKKYKVPPGVHAVTVRAPDGNSSNLTLDVKKGKTVKQVVDLRPPKK
jgi:hypothetical protein